MRVVVGAAVLDGRGRVLAARREHPAGWEFPGGKVEDGEGEPVAVARELAEELGVAVAVGARVGPDVPVAGGDLVLRVWTARITAGVPVATEHAALRWVGAADLGSLDWLPADRPVLSAVAALLTGDEPPRG